MAGDFQHCAAGHFFHADFEGGNTLLRESFSIGQNEITLVRVNNIEDWPLNNGQAWIRTSRFSEPKKFTYLRRKALTLMGIENSTASFPAYSEIQTILYSTFTDIHRKNVSLVSPGLSGLGAIKIDFASKGHVLLRAKYEAVSNLYGSFRVKISKKALSSHKKGVSWFFSIAPHADWYLQKFAQF